MYCIVCVLSNLIKRILYCIVLYTVTASAGVPSKRSQKTTFVDTVCRPTRSAKFCWKEWLPASKCQQVYKIPCAQGWSHGVGRPTLLQCTNDLSDPAVHSKELTFYAHYFSSPSFLSNALTSTSKNHRCHQSVWTMYGPINNLRLWFFTKRSNRACLSVRLSVTLWYDFSETPTMMQFSPHGSHTTPL